MNGLKSSKLLSILKTLHLISMNFWLELIPRNRSAKILWISTMDVMMKIKSKSAVTFAKSLQDSTSTSRTAFSGLKRLQN